MCTNISNYTRAVRWMIDLKGAEQANVANHKALEKGIITLQQFQAAARIIAKETSKNK